MTLNMALLTSRLHTHGDDDSCPGSHCCTRRTPPSWWSENPSSHLPWERSVPFGSLFWILDRYDLSSFHLSFSQRTDHTGRLIQLKWFEMTQTSAHKKNHKGSGLWGFCHVILHFGKLSWSRWDTLSGLCFSIISLNLLSKPFCSSPSFSVFLAGEVVTLANSLPTDINELWWANRFKIEVFQLSSALQHFK